MISTQCEWEQAVIEALASGSWPEQLQVHVAGCPGCADVILVTQLFREAAVPTREDPLPDPGMIWRAAARAERQQAVDRATWPITVMTRLALAACVVATVAGIAWLWSAMQGQLFTLVRSLLVPAPPGAAEIPATMVAVASFAVFVAAFRLFESWAAD